MNEFSNTSKPPQGGYSSDVVLMPWIDKSNITIKGSAAHSDAVPRWDFIVEQLSEGKSIGNIFSLIDVISSYNTYHVRKGSREKSSWMCHALIECFEEMTSNEINEFFCEDGILSTIRQLVIRSNEIVPEVKLLKSGVNEKVTLHRYQIAALLANAFLCTFPPQLVGYPTINFITLFEGDDKKRRRSSIEKIKCLLNYFRRVKEEVPIGYITYHRIWTPSREFPKWETSNARLSELIVKMKGNVEDQNGHLQMDFANKFVGGGILGRGSLQEEIRFAISPELIVARLFTQCLGDNEALLVKGTERYSRHAGFGGSFRFAGNFRDNVPFDGTDHKMSHVIMLDALNFSHPPDQYLESKIIRELNKAYAGFQQTDLSQGLPLATGNWGCGAFQGDPQLKLLIQLIACSQAGRKILYLTYGNFSLKDSIQSMYNILKERKITVGTIYRIVRLYRRHKKENQTLFEFINDTISSGMKRVDTRIDADDQQVNDPSASVPAGRKSPDSDQECDLFGKRMRTSFASGGTSRLKTELCDSASVSNVGCLNSKFPAIEDVEMLGASSMDTVFEANNTDEKSKIENDSVNWESQKLVSEKMEEEHSELTTPQSPKPRKHIQTKIDSFFWKASH